MNALQAGSVLTSLVDARNLNVPISIAGNGCGLTTRIACAKNGVVVILHAWMDSILTRSFAIASRNSVILPRVPQVLTLTK